MSDDEKRKQVAAQCKVVAHLATALAQVSSDYQRMFEASAANDLITGSASNLIELVGARSARHMEILGDILNGMDAIGEDDEWVNPIFKLAHEFWPARQNSGFEGPFSLSP